MRAVRICFSKCWQPDAHTEFYCEEINLTFNFTFTICTYAWVWCDIGKQCGATRSKSRHISDSDTIGHYVDGLYALMCINKLQKCGWLEMQ